MATSSRVMVIGLDGLDYELFEPHVPDWLCAVPLRSQIGLTGPEWLSIWTGIPAPDLGFWGAGGEAREGYSDRPITLYRDLAGTGKLFWEIAESAGHTAAICGAPCCYPAQIERGWISARCNPGLGYFARGPESTCQKPDRRLPMPKGDWGPENLTKAHGEFTEFFVANAEGCDVGFIYFRFIDGYVHRRYLLDDGMRQWAYGEAVALIEGLREALQPEHLFVVSDHGGIANTHRDCGVFAWEPTEVTPAREGDVVLTPSGQPWEYGWLERVDVVETPWRLGTEDVAALFLKPLGLEPPAVDQTHSPYSEAEAEQVHKRLREIGYIE